MHPLFVAVLGACTSDPASTDRDVDDRPATTGATADTGGAPHTGTTDPCAEDPDLRIVSFTASSGPIGTQVELAVSLSASASVAARCRADAVPEEVFLVEGTAPAKDHRLRMSGLLPANTWTCEAVAVCPGAVGPAATTTFTTPTPPSGLAPLEVTVDPELGTTGAWTLAPYAADKFYAPAWLVIWGPDGRVRWWTPLPEGVGRWVEARFHPEDAKIVWGGGMHPEGRIRTVDLWEGEVDAWAPEGWQGTEFHHDGKRLADGRWMTLEVRENSRGALTWDGFGVRVVDPGTGEVAFEYDSQRAVDQGDLPPRRFSDDPYHANWMDLVDTADGPEAWISLCVDHSLLVVDAVTGATRFVLGADRGWTVSDADGTPLGQDALPQCQHGAEVTPSRDLWVYDNGQDRGQSEAQLWSIDPATRTARRQWRWTEEGWFDEWLGDIDDLGHGRVWLTMARKTTPPAELVEVDRATGRVASRLRFSSGGYTYRSERYDGCAFFDSARDCPTRAARLAELAPRFDAR